VAQKASPLCHPKRTHQLQLAPANEGEAKRTTLAILIVEYTAKMRFQSPHVEKRFVYIENNDSGHFLKPV